MSTEHVPALFHHLHEEPAARWKLPIGVPDYDFLIMQVGSLLRSGAEGLGFRES